MVPFANHARYLTREQNTRTHMLVTFSFTSLHKQMD